MSLDDCPEWAPDSDLDAQYEDRYAMPDETTEEDPSLDPADSGNYDALEESASDPETGTTYGDLT